MSCSYLVAFKRIHLIIDALAEITNVSETGSPGAAGSLERSMEMGLEILEDMGMRHPWKGHVEPFRMIGNLYFVGTVPASSHLIDTGGGLLLLDTGLPQSVYLILEGIRRLGFDPSDIRWIVHSHGHYDHLGGTRAIAELTGARTYIGRPDAPLASGEQDLTWARELGAQFYEAFEPDVLIDDGDVLHFGNTNMECLLTPGHSLGTLTMFWNIEGADRPLTAAMHGGTGQNTLAADWLRSHGMPLSIRDEFRAGLRRVRDRHVDVVVGNHVGHNGTLEKAALLKRNPAANPFVDPTEWKRFLLDTERSLDEMLAREGTPGIS
ncbi:MAG: MBL fold metallo-hydrolase [Clostridiales bacterium]|nr:MBL fold metallo-hydrolase [Clostridiales bacterium]OQA29461.1 MAG: Metallo-beta-lactamase L1 precursor [Verrucomicrobia bacterium ADurb.Bin345]